MAHQHSARFLKIVDDARKRIREVSLEDVKAQARSRRTSFFWSTYAKKASTPTTICPGRFIWARALLSGILRNAFPNWTRRSFSIAAADIAPLWPPTIFKKWDTPTSLSMDGGIRGWREKHFPLTRE